MPTLTESHVIMVDDNDGDIYIARHCFRKSKLDNPWMSFTNGSDFLQYLRRVKRGEAPMPALVLLDINMPGMSGHEVLEETRADRHFEDLPIFCMLSSSSDPRDEAMARRAGASDFVTKPSSTEEYIAFFDGFAQGQ
jgi:CheY-like chemotaxis protein